MGRQDGFVLGPHGGSSLEPPRRESAGRGSVSLLSQPLQITQTSVPGLDFGEWPLEDGETAT